MWLTSVPFICTLWLMANASALRIPSDTHTRTGTPTVVPTKCLLLEFTCKFACRCVSVCVCVMLKHFGGHDLPLASRQISINLEKYTRSCNSSTTPTLRWENDTLQVRAGQIKRPRPRQRKRKRTKGRRGEDRQGKHFACHCVQKAERQN